MTYLIRRQYSNGKSKTMPLHGKLMRIQPQPGVCYGLVDAKTGKFPEHTVVKRAGKNLIFEINDGEAVVELTEFFTEDAAGNSYFAEINGTGCTIANTANDFAGLHTDTQPLAHTPQSDDIGVAFDVTQTGFGRFFSAAGAGLTAVLMTCRTADSSSSTPVTAVQSVSIRGAVTAGPIFAGVIVVAYDKNGTELGRSAVASDSTFSIIVTNGYNGIVTLRAVDENSASTNYESETTGNLLSLGIDLRVVGIITESSTEAIINITPLTEVSARLLGVDSNHVVPVSESVVVMANKAISDLFALDSILGNVIALNDTRFNASDGISMVEKYGLVLASLSGLDEIRGGLDKALEMLASMINIHGGAATISQEGGSSLPKERNAF